MKFRVKYLGQALVEMMVGLGIAAALMPAITTSFFAARGGSAQEESRLQASGRLREAREVLRLLKESSWTNVASNGTYGLSLNSGVWSLNPTIESNLDGLFSRQVVIGDAYRTPLKQLSTLSNGNTLDPSVKHIIITVSWDKPTPSSVISNYYLMRLENLTWIQTTVADFGLGTQAGTAIRDTEGGEVILGSGGAALSDWCDPSLSTINYNIDGAANPNAISAKVGSGISDNQIITGTGNSANGVALVHLSVTNTTTPVIGVLGTLLDSSPRIKTNSVFVDSTKAYITTDNKHKEVIFIDLASHTETGSFNAPVNSNGAGIYVVGGVGFVTVGNVLYTFNSATGASISSLALSGEGGRIFVQGSYAYIVETSGTKPLEIVQFSPDGTSLSIVGDVRSGQNGIAPSQTGVDVSVNSTGSRTYLATTQGNVYILDSSNPNLKPLPQVMGDFSTSGMTPTGISVVTGNKAIVVGTGGSLQYQVVDIESENDPNLCTKGGTTTGGLSIPSGVMGIASIQEEDGDAFSYIITLDSSAELKVIQGGSGGGGGTYALDGTFESSIFDAGYSVMFNRFDVTSIAPPPDTTIEYQVAISNPGPTDCTDAVYSFVGPGLSPTAYFSGSSELPLGSGLGYTNPGRCLKYRAHLNTQNTNSTPVLYDITFNYSP